MKSSELTDQIRHVLQDSRLNLPPPNNPEAACGLFLGYIQLWEKWNGKINLTAETDPLDFLQRHVFVSLQFARTLGPGERVLDIGSGAGLPGIPLKIQFPDLDLVLVESQRKRASFLATVVRELPLAGARVIHDRAEELGAEYHHYFDTVVFRAVSDTPECLQLAEPRLKPGGRAVLLKTQENTATPLAHPYFSEPRALPVKSYQNELFQLVVYTKSD